MEGLVHDFEKKFPMRLISINNQRVQWLYLVEKVFFNLLINILLITIKAILKTCSINKNVFTSKKSVGKT